MATLKDIAERAGISVTAASLAIRDHRTISIETKRRVWEAQEKLGYKTDLLRRSLRQDSAPGRTGNIGFLLIERPFNTPAYSSFFESLANHAAARKLRSIYLSAKLSDLHAGKFPLPLTDRQVDGLVVSGLYDEAAHRALSKLNIPIVVMGNYELGLEPWAACELDLSQGMRLLVTRLKELGHSRLGLISFTTIETEFTWQLRCSYLRALSVAGLTNAGIGEEDETMKVRRGTRKLLEAPDRPTALILPSETAAVEVYDACEQAGLSIPKDLSVVSFGCGGYVIRPTVASVQPHHGQIGSEIVRKLTRLIEEPGQLPTRELVSMRFVGGGSVGRCPALTQRSRRG